ncbi:hypothetical protein G7046_g147 [Stylonectria norvegica]|nr:hypothetical protein G7046_g147 [Stylonectria norvegica]
MATQRLFITGANGYVGSVITSLAIKEGYTVHGLSRSEAGDEKLRSLGAVPIRGDLTSLDVLRQESAQADAVIHLATAYVFGGPIYETVLPVDNAAVDAIAESLVGTGKPLVVTSGTLITNPDPTGAETTEASPLNPKPINTRHKAEDHALTYANKGIRVTSVRLAPFVYGRAGSGVKMFMTTGAEHGVLALVNGGKHTTTAVHVDDAAQLYLLAAQKGKAGEIYNASGDANVSGRALLQAIANAVGIPTIDIPYEAAVAQMGETVAMFLSAENKASGAKAVEELGWKPTGNGILDDIENGSYKALAESLKKK